jgi:hypothetical protein
VLGLGLSKSDRKAFESALASSHRVRVRAAVHNHDEKRIGALDTPRPRVLDGAVQVDATADVTRSLELTLADPKGKLVFDPASPGQGGLFARYMISIEYGVFVEDLSDWIDVPVFWGPLTGYSHQGGIVSIEAQGKEALMLDPHLVVQGYKIDENTRVDDAIRKVARRAGERRFSLSNFPTRIKPHDLVVEPKEEPWRVIKGGREKGRSILDYTGENPEQIFYNGRGRLTARRLQKETAWRFDGDLILTRPEITYDLLGFANYVVVQGGESKGSKRKARGVAQLPKKHPLSPYKLRRNGEPDSGKVPLFIDAPNLKTDEECEKRARQVLKQRSRIGVEAAFESLPVPHLEELDTVGVDTSGEGSVRFPLRQFTIPLVAGQSMSIGFNKRVRSRRRHRRRGRDFSERRDRGDR